MATTKTLTPTNQAITLAAFTEKPDNRTNVTNDDKLADAVNALNSKITHDWDNISSWCSSAESEATTHIQKFGAMRAITFRGVSRSHAEDEVLMTIPEGNRPLTNMYTVSTIGAIPVVIQINSGNGNVTLFLANNAGTGRIHFSIAYVANIT